MAVSDLPEGVLTAAASVPAEGANEAKPRRVSVTKLATVLHGLVQPSVSPEPAGLHIGVSDGFSEARSGAVAGQDVVLMLHPMAAAVSAPPPPPDPAALTFTAPDTATAGVYFDATIQNTGGSASGAWSLNVPSGWSVTPSSGASIAAGATVTVAIVATAGTQDLTLTCVGATITGNPQSVVASAAPSYATSIGISVTGSTVTGSTATVVITPNGPIHPGGGTASIAISGGGTLGSGTVALTAGSSGPFTTTLVRATDGTTALSLSNNIGLTNSPSTASYTSTAPAAAGDPAAFTLTSSTSGTLPFAIGYALRQGDVPSGSAIAISGATARASILSTWPDGSARFAVVAGTYTSAGSAVTVTPSAGVVSAGAALTGAAAQSAMGASTAVFDAGAFGSATFSGADFASPFATHFASDLCAEFVYRKPIGSDAHLVAWLALRVWSGGAVEVLPWIENGYLTVAGPTSKAATFTFSLGGSQRFSGAIDLPARCRTPLVSGATLSHWLGTDPAVTPAHDTLYLQATDMVPSYDAVVPANSSIWATLPTSFTPLQQGIYRDVMSATGYHPSIGLLPQWDVVYLTNAADPRAYGAVIRQGYSAGRYASHYRDENTNRPIRLSQRATDTTGTAAAAGGTTAPVYDTGHHPSMGFLAYLLTGRFYFMEEVQFVATYNYLRQSADVTNIRQGASGIFQSASGDCTVRGASWCIRTLAQAAIASSDGDAVGTDLKASLEANIAWNHARYVAQANNGFGLVEPYSTSYGSANGHQIEAPWQQDFYTAAFGYMLAAQPSISSTALAKLTAFFAWKAQWAVGRLGAAGASNYLYADAAQYNLEVCATGADFGGGTGPWPASWATIYGWNFVTSNTSDPGALRGGNFPGAASYWGNLFPAISYAVRHGVSGADAAYARLIDATNGYTQERDFLTAPEWSVIPRMPTPYSVPSWGNTANISRNSYSSVCYPASWFTTFPNISPWRNWSCAVYANRFSHYGAMVYWGGGHDGGAQTDAPVFDLDTAQWSLVGPGQPPTMYVGEMMNYTVGSLMDPTWGDYDWNGSKIIPATHTYAYTAYLSPRIPGSGSKGSWALTNFVSGFGGGMHVHQMDLSTGVMVRGSSNVGTYDTKPGFAGVLVDPVRQKAYWGAAEAVNINTIDLAASVPRTISAQSVGGASGKMGQNQAYYPVYVYLPEADRWLEIASPYGSDVLQIGVFSTVSGTLTWEGFATVPSTGRPSLYAGYGVDWCPITGKLYIYQAAGTSQVYTLACSDPTAPRTATWTWGQETFNGAAWATGFGSGGGGLAFNHWRYIPKLRCFIWTNPSFSATCQDGSTHDGAVQLWRPAGT